MKAKLLKKLRRDVAATSIYQLAINMKIPYATLWRIINEETGNIKTWEKIATYYMSKVAKKPA